MKKQHLTKREDYRSPSTHVVVITLPFSKNFCSSGKKESITEEWEEEDLSNI